MVLLFLLVAVFFFVLFGVCVLLAAWLAFGRTHVFVRMPAFLFGTLAIGLVFSLAATQVPECTLGGVSGIVLLALSLAPTTRWWIRLPLLLYSALMLLLFFQRLELPEFECAWIVRITVATTLVASVLGALRLFRLRVVNLTEGVSALEMEKATGRDLDGWIAVLDQAMAETWNHAEIMAFVRQCGLEFSWQKAITSAYEKAIGRRSVVLAADRRGEMTVDHANWRFVDWLTCPRQSQFSIWQLMLATFCAACLLGFLRALGWYRPAVEDYIYGIPLIAGITVIALATFLGSLAIRAVRRKMAVATAVVLVTAVIIRHTMRLNVSMLPGFYAAALIFEGVMMACFILVRHRGYRLVRIQTRKQPRVA